MRHQHLLEYSLGVGERHWPVVGAQTHKTDVTVSFFPDNGGHHVRGIETAPMLVIGEACAVAGDIIKTSRRAQMIKCDVAKGILRSNGFPVAKDSFTLIDHGQVGDQPAIRPAATPDPKVEGNEALQIPQYARAKLVRFAFGRIVVKL